MDAVSEIILDNAKILNPAPERILLIDAPELVRAAQAVAPCVVYCDDVRDRDITPSRFRIDALDADTLAGVEQVWWRLPLSVAAVAEYAELIAAYASPDVTIVGGARQKYLTRSMNAALAKSFERVGASLGAKKCRALMARDPKGADVTWPRSKRVDEVNLEVFSFGSTFAALRLDNGSRLMVKHLDEVAPLRRMVDLGCGSGIFATLLARQFPGSEVLGSDVSLAAVKAARLTAEAAGVEITVQWQDGLRNLPAQSVDVVCCNPPFHRHGAQVTSPARQMFADAARVLVRGGEFWCVFNSHLPWKADLQRMGPTQIVDRADGYTLTRTIVR